MQELEATIRLQGFRIEGEWDGDDPTIGAMYVGPDREELEDYGWKFQDHPHPGYWYNFNKEMIDMTAEALGLEVEEPRVLGVLQIKEDE